VRGVLILAFETGLMWSVYNDMERTFMEFLDYVPLAKDHNKVYSHKLLRLMLEIGGYVDTAFKEISLYPKFDGDAKCETIRKMAAKGKTVKISLFREAFEPIYHLSRRTILMKSPRHFASPPLAIDLFNPFSEFGKGKAPNWWKAYNKVKHNWLKNLKKANVKNTLRALGGAFLLNVVHEPSLLELAKRGVAMTFDVEGRRIRVGEELLTKLIKRERPPHGIIIIGDTQLFRWRFK